MRLILIFLVLLLALLLWQGYSGYHQFKQFHQQLSERSVTSTAREIQVLMKTMNKTVGLFADQEKDTIRTLLNDNIDRATKEKLAKKIHRHFPNHLTFLLADKNGVIQYNHTEELVGKTCRIELLDYAKSNFKDNPVFVHPGSMMNSDHFDVLTPLLTDEGKKIGVFFISFRLETLRRLLSHGEIVDHHLLLLRTDKPDKIELKSNPNFLSDIQVLPPKLLERIYYSKDIKNSLWNLVDVPDNSLLTKEYLRLLVQGLIVLFVFLLISGLMLWVLRKEDQKSGKTHGLLSALQNERRRIAMDMHDQVLSELSHISREADQLKINPNSEKNITLLTNNLKEVTSSIRSIINDLHPHILDNLGLESALRDCLQKHFINSYSPEWSLNIEADLEPLLDNEQRFNLYRIILEIVNNIQKHAECTCFSIIMRLEVNILRLVIEDNGKGFDVSRSHKGLGLNNIETRCRLLKARMNWNKPRKSKGSRFVLTMKLTPTGQ